MFKKILLFLLVGVISYISFLIATLPASFVWKYLSPQLPLKPLQINVKGLSGTVWDGEAYVSSKGIEGVLDWDISLTGLFAGQLPIQLAVKSSAGTLNTDISVFSNGVELSGTKGKINLQALNTLFKRQRVTLNGDLTISSLELGYFDRAVTSATGQFDWSGGRVEYPAGREMHGSQFPPFIGKISQKGDIALMHISDTESSVNAIEAQLDRTGTATLRVKRRLLDLANEPWPKNSSENDVVFKAKRRIM
ncbi:type II secretion system protein N [Alkalimarinus coralli]|uniref:type II secretion system protein N n=1 Tax=Alkalimarinus coralli TaxID=2935863 RepID=UPI00202AC6EB|nr:type II secretion system protein N [Alkalimarinus coralli]